MKSIIQFDKNFEGKMANIKTRYSAKETKVSKHATNTNSGFATDIKLWTLVRGMSDEGGKKVFVGRSAQNDKGFCEITEGDETQLAIATLKTLNNVFKIELSAATINASGVYVPYPDTRRGSVLCGALIGLLTGRDRELYECLTALEKWVPLDENADDWDDPITSDEFGKEINLLTNNLYYQIKEYNFDLNQIKTLRVNDRKNILNGIIPFTKNSPKGMDLSKAAPGLTLQTGKYSFTGNRAFTAEEQALIPSLPKSYIMPQWCDTICEEIKESSIFQEPFRNVLLTGPAGTGKTKGATAMAQALGLPYVKTTCSPDTDMFELIGQMLPNTTRTSLPKDLPTFDDVANDYIGTFKKLFGKEPGPLDCEADCYAEIYKRATEAQKSEFTYVESDFIKAIKYGWLVEIQEPTVIKRNSVLVGLNAILENDAESSITLPTGEVIKRHPHAVVVMTTNSDYDGCNKIQQSVLSRAEIVRKIPNPEASVLAERTMKATGWKDKKLMDKMANVVLETAAYSAEKDIRDGICGPRELLNWAKAAILRQAKKDGVKPLESLAIEVETLMEAAFSTVFEKLSQTPEDMEEILTGVFAKQFDQGLIESARLAYEAGL